MHQRAPVSLIPGQSRPLAVRIIFSGVKLTHLGLRVWWRSSDASFQERRYINFRCQLVDRKFGEPHRITFLHPSGTVSYAILRPPSAKACLNFPNKHSMPIMLNLHGAGLDVNDHQVRSMLDPVPDLPGWVISPSGVTTWSGDDWRETLTLDSK